MQTSAASALWSLPKKAFIRHLAGCFASTAVDGEPGNRRNAVPACQQRLQRLNYPETEGTDDTGADDCDTGGQCFYAYCSRCLHLAFFDAQFLVAFSGETFTNEPQTKTEARKLVDCQLSLFSGDLKSDKREQS